MNRSVVRLTGFVFCWGLASCATYDERIQTAHRAYYNGDLDRTIAVLQEVIADDDVDRDVAELELATVFQAAGRYAESTWLLEEADQQNEVMDYTSMPLQDMATYVLGGEIQDYRTSPPERVLVNTLNMINYLGLDDPEEAAVEARRLSILLDRTDVPEDELYANRFAWSLAGLTFEMARDHQEAEDAWRAAADSPLADRKLTTGALEPGARPGTVLVIVQRGKVPMRREAAYYFPIGGGLHTLRVPTLVSRYPGFGSAAVTVDGEALGGVPMLFNLGAHAHLRFKREFPRLLAAAVAQAIPRTVLTESLRRSAIASSGDDNVATVVAAAWIASFLLDIALANLATTDTRCWSMLPESFHARRLNLSPGPHTVMVKLLGPQSKTLPFEVDVRPGRLTLINVTSAIYEGYQELPPARSRDMSEEAEVAQALALLEAATWWRSIVTD
jgi:hypothetical protein